jgi:menaquinone-specific isochorismate synthase
MEGVAPDAVLRLGTGAPRGFWAREGRWFAHAGCVTAVEAPSGDVNRFQAVWMAAQDLLGRVWTDPLGFPDSPPARLFGGFSFSEDHRSGGSWEGFPSAYFILPEVELIGGEEGGVLTLRRAAENGEDPATVLASLKEELGSMADSLAAGPRSEVGGNEAEIMPCPETDRVDWAGMVERALAAFDRGQLSKVVLARAVSASPDPEADPVEVGMNLWRWNPGSHVFFFEPVPGHVLVGAAPETIATVDEGAFRATAVAGSAARGENRTEQEALASELLSSEKDRREHLLSVEDMVQRLSAIAEAVHAEADPHVLTLSAIQHLETAITARLRPGETVLSALKALHPTPAVCGFPRDEALALLLSEERFPRGWYAGPVGWLDVDGNGVFVPALRSAVGVDGEWQLFAGAGIVAGSDPEKEWNETLIKFQPVLKALAGADRTRCAGSRS